MLDRKTSVPVTRYLNFEKSFRYRGSLSFGAKTKYIWHAGPLKLLKGYLVERKQLIVIGGIQSDLCEVFCGVPRAPSWGTCWFEFS